MRENDPFLDVLCDIGDENKALSKCFQRELKGRGRWERGREKGRRIERDEGREVWGGREQRGGIKQQRGAGESRNEGWGNGLLIQMSSAFLTWACSGSQGFPVWVRNLAIITCLALLPQGQSTHHRVAEKIHWPNSVQLGQLINIVLWEFFGFSYFKCQPGFVTGEEAYVTLPLEVSQYPCLVGKHYVLEYSRKPYC